MADIFISYSRKDIAYARILHKALKESEFETWIDWQDIPPSTEWLAEVYTAIEEASTFIFILSDSSTLSEVCTLEIEHAEKNNKRIIPILIDDVYPSKVHPALATINWIFSRTEDELQPAIESLIEAIQTDYDWIKAHTRLQVRALEWDRADEDKSYLLHGTDLQQAEIWLAASEDKQLEPTVTQIRYIQASRREASNRQRRLLMGVGAALIATIVLGILAFLNGQRAEQNAHSLATQVVVAEENAHLAHIRELTAVSQQAEIRFDISILLGLESFNAIENYQTRSNLFRLVQKNSEALNVYSHDRVETIALSPDGKIMASGAEDGTIILWDLDSGMVIGDPLSVSGGDIKTVAFSPDGKMMASGTEGGTSVLWDTETMEVRGKIDGATDAHHIIFSPDGKKLASLSSDRSIVIVDLTTMQVIGNPIRDLTTNFMKGELVFSPGGETLVAGMNNLLIVDLESQQVVTDLLQDRENTSVLCVDMNPDGSILASAGEDNRITLWDLGNLQQLGEPFGAFSSAIEAIAFSPDGSKIAAGSWDRSISLYDVNTREPIGEPLVLHNGRVNDIIFSPDGEKLFSSSEDGTIIRWDLARKAIAGEILSPAKGNVPFGSLSSNGDKIAVFRDNNDIILYDVFSGQPVGQPLEGNGESTARIAFSPDGNTFVSIDEKSTIRVWDVPSGVPVRSLDRSYACGPGFNPSCDGVSFAFSPDGSLLAIGGVHIDSSVTLWDVPSGEMIDEPFAEDLHNITSLAFSPDGKTLAVGFEAGSYLYDVGSRQRISSGPRLHSDWTTSIAFTPQGDLFASSGGGTIVFWDPSLKTTLSEPVPALIDWMHLLTFSPDGSRMAVAGGEGFITLWDVAAMLPLGDPISLPQRPMVIQDIAFSGDGNRLISVQGDGTIYAWDISPAAWRDYLCDKVGRNFTQEEWALYFPDEPYRVTCEKWPEGK
jgi:WD40 repeat protein